MSFTAFTYKICTILLDWQKILWNRRWAQTLLKYTDFLVSKVTVPVIFFVDNIIYLIFKYRFFNSKKKKQVPVRNCTGTILRGSPNSAVKICCRFYFSSFIFGNFCLERELQPEQSIFFLEPINSLLAGSLTLLLNIFFIALLSTHWEKVHDPALKWSGFATLEGYNNLCSQVVS